VRVAVAAALAVVNHPRRTVSLTLFTSQHQFAMKAKKFLMIGLLTAGLAASGFAAFSFSSGSCSGKECCTPACCEGAEAAECCKTGN
jgi:hypothetical protein